VLEGRGLVSNVECPLAQEPRPLTAFAADARKLDGLRDVCQPCRTAQLASARGSTGAHSADVVLQLLPGKCKRPSAEGRPNALR
jgi:hypothetical protein